MHTPARFQNHAALAQPSFSARAAGLQPTPAHS